MRLTLLLALLFAANAPVEVQASDSREMPAEFEHDLVWLVPEINGERIRFFTDTGGGFNAISQATAERLKLHREEAAGDGGRRIELAAFPRFDAGRALPDAPLHFMDGRLMVVAEGLLPGKQGFLGGRWFADGVWEFDYPAGRLRQLRGSPDMPDVGKVPLGFQVNAAGKRTMHFPSMPITVDGEVLVVLLDTGASATLTPSSGQAFGLPAGTSVGTSFIEHEVFERWKQNHPDWRVLEDADEKGDERRRMIEVPQITVGGHVVGPVWFSEQPPGSFQRYMTSMMDQPTWGALGGSGLKYFTMTIDYPAATAHFTMTGKH